MIQNKSRLDTEQDTFYIPTKRAIRDQMIITTTKLFDPGKKRIIYVHQSVAPESYQNALYKGPWSSLYRTFSKLQSSQRKKKMKRCVWYKISMQFSIVWLHILLCITVKMGGQQLEKRKNDFGFIIFIRKESLSGSEGLALQNT